MRKSQSVEAFFQYRFASSYRWYRDTFCDYEKLMAKEQGEDPYDLINKQIATSPIGANGITPRCISSGCWRS
ncbi:MAG: hypothetical protein ACLR2D_01820 [Anaerobutyricum hallii]